MKLTLSQIAEMAGVSRGTVDRVIHQRGRVSKESKEKILKIIKEYDYQPNALGSALARNKPYKIGIILIEKHNPFFQVIKSGALEAVEAYKDYDIQLEIRHISSLNENEYLDALNDLENEVNAFAVIGLNTEKIIDKINEIVEKNIPVMTMNIDLPDSHREGFFGLDNYQGGMCVGYMIKDIVRDDEHVLLMSGDRKIESEQLRLDGFYHIMKDYPNIHLSEVYYTQDIPENVYSLTKQALLKQKYKVILSVSSHVGMVVKAIKDLQINSSPCVFGFDLISGHYESLVAGDITCILDQSAFLQGKQTIISICEYLIHKRPLPQGCQFLPIAIYNKYNI